jgi:hypothetical protein
VTPDGRHGATDTDSSHIPGKPSRSIQAAADAVPKMLEIRAVRADTPPAYTRQRLDYSSMTTMSLNTLKHHCRSCLSVVHGLSRGVRYPAECGVPPDLNSILPAPVAILTHHKSGTNWLHGIFQRIAYAYRLRFVTTMGTTVPNDFDILMSADSQISRELLPTGTRCLHLIRDPRDMLVSSTFYHETSREGWLHFQRADFQGMTYQEKLRSLASFEEKLLFELDNAHRWCVEHIAAWDYDRSNTIEIKYEHLLAGDDLDPFIRIFRHLGFPSRSLGTCLSIAYHQSLYPESNLLVQKTTTQRRHIRSGRQGQWQQLFTKAVRERFRQEYGGLLIRLGYEESTDWAD